MRALSSPALLVIQSNERRRSRVRVRVEEFSTPIDAGGALLDGLKLTNWPLEDGDAYSSKTL
jgi:hypothetical protein